MPYSELVRRSDPGEAFLLLTRIPAPWPATPRGARAGWAWPIAGACVGLVAASVATVALLAGLSPGVAAALALATQAMATGGLHEDGLADSADGLWGGGTPDRRLAIMSDSRIGSYGALALMLGILIRWSALSGLLAGGHAWGPLVAVGALSRWPMLAVLWALPPARDGGLSRLVGRPGTPTLVLAGLVALGLALAGAGTSAFLAAAAVLALAALWWRLVEARLGGQTGDTCGAAQQLTEMAALLALAAWPH
ncbi:adenosylcobinamide-GDP ribazoletransferase [Rubellimicrobium arenae]|uniref:adenosylcobinamide-GDP ribazoletransferase n=1 Tax=Rubellimicrobium arenae TaxID=2817372 RepID=UPI001B3064C2|nr:adenosylcobinamide-GDP ribazoletransferase [Rubellimicrobium arenae]